MENRLETGVRVYSTRLLRNLVLACPITSNTWMCIDMNSKMSENRQGLFQCSKTELVIGWK